MKIAITSLYLPSGSKIGVGYQVHYLANQLVKRGHDVTVFSQTGPSPDSMYSVNVIKPRRCLRTFGFAWDLRSCNFDRFDVLNAHGDDWFLWGCQRPRHIHTFHGSCLAEVLHTQSVREKFRMSALAACEYGACFLADELVGVSENTRRFVPFIRHVIPNGVDLKAFTPGEKSRRPSLLFVGTLRGRKRGALLLESFSREIRQRVPDAELWAVCDEKVEGDGVRWFGRIPTRQLAELYRSAWVFCLPSSYEGFGIPYIEAMASGTAVVATPNLGASEVTRGGIDGVLASEDDLAGAIVKLLTDEDLRARFEQRGLSRAEDFSWQRVCGQYEDLYSGELSPLEQAQAA
jgi:phosphatidyl-myo-inositol alpha-mannosyltransferase